MKEALEVIYDYALEEIMGQRFGSYSKYIIQDRSDNRYFRKRIKFSRNYVMLEYGESIFRSYYEKIF